MTMNQLTQATAPNTAAATSVSPLEQSGSSKTKFLQSQPELAKSNVRTEVCNPDNYLCLLYTSDAADEHIVV